MNTEGLIRHICRGYFLPGGDRDDLLQEARLAVVEAEQAWDGTGPFEQFAAMVVRRRVIDAVKHATRGKHQFLSHAARDDTLETRQDDRGDPFAVVAMRETFAELAVAAGRLSVSERRCVMGVAAGFTYAELGGRAKQVDMAVQRARRKLREAA